jgi:hypothetical protein
VDASGWDWYPQAFFPSGASNYATADFGAERKSREAVSIERHLNQIA